MWGGRLASILWGAEAVEGRRLASQPEDPGDYGKYWRASPAAVQEIRRVGDGFAAAGADMAEVASPETYVGYDRAQHFASPGGFAGTIAAKPPQSRPSTGAD